MDYINLYNDTYAEAEKICENSILKKIKNYKKDKRNYNFCSNNLLKEFRVIEKEFRILQPPYNDLSNLYKRRADEFEPEYYMEVIPQTLLPEFKKIIHKDQNFTFEIFITELAKANAYNNCYRIFNNNYNLYKMMYEINNFDEFKLDESLGRESSDFYEKYRLLVYEPESLEKDKLIGSMGSNSIEKNIFNLTPKFIKIFKNQDFYNALVKEEYIDKENTKFDDFKNVFFVNLTKHNSTINFFCDKYEAMYLLRYLGKKKKGQLSQQDIGNSKRFKGYDGETLTQSNISRSKDNLEPCKISRIENFIDCYL